MNKSKSIIKGMSSAQGDVGQWGLLSIHTAQPVGDGSTQDDEVAPAFMHSSLGPVSGRASSCSFMSPARACGHELHALCHLQVILLDGKDGQFRDAAPGWQ